MNPAEIAASLGEEDAIYLEAVLIHGCGPADEDEMLSSERLIELGLIKDTERGQRCTHFGRTVAKELEKPND